MAAAPYPGVTSSLVSQGISAAVPILSFPTEIAAVSGAPQATGPALPVDLDLTARIDGSILATAATPGPSLTTPAAPAAPVPPSQAPLVAQQIAQALRDHAAAPDTPLDLALDPPELGRLRLSFSEAGGALTLTITADRAETAELMRRHLNLLAEEFGRAGVDAPQVNISHGDASGHDRSATRAPTGLPADAEGGTPATSNTLPLTGPKGMVDGGLDLRL